MDIIKSKDIQKEINSRLERLEEKIIKKNDTGLAEGRFVNCKI